jgi:hypothetical protein
MNLTNKTLETLIRDEMLYCELFYLDYLNHLLIDVINDMLVRSKEVNNMNANTKEMIQK